MSLSLRPGALFARPALFFLTLLAAFVVSGFAARQASASSVIYYVSTTGTGSGSSWTNASSNLQGIITAAHSGDQVWVKYGTYTGNFTATDGVSVYGHFAGTETSTSARQLTNSTYTTTLNANGNGTVYYIPSAATGTNRLDGFSIENGLSRGVNDPSGDKIIIANCTIANNSISYANGGGVYTSGATAMFSNCFFSDNTLSTNGTNIYGAGLYAAPNTQATISLCTFSGNNAPGFNSSGYGGAIYTAGTGIISNCTINSNNASTSGGGIGASGNAVTVTDCSFTGNTGGGIYASCTTNTVTGCSFTNNVGRGVTVAGTNTSTITSCTFTGNHIYDAVGGGLYVGSSVATVTGCVFSGNYLNTNGVNLYGGGLFTAIDTVVAVSDCTFSGNTATPFNSTASGGGIGGFGTPSITRCTFMNNSPDEIDLENVGSPSDPATIKDSLIYGAGTSAGNGINLGIQGQSTTFAYVTVANNDIVDANAGINIGANSDATGTIDVANNIFYANNGAVNDNSSVTFASSHNDLFDNVSYKYQGSGITTSSTDLMVDPMFVRNPNFGASPVDYGDLHLQSASPLINAGDDSYVSSGDTDYAGDPRIIGSHVDIGAYEAPSNSAAHLTSLSPNTLQAGHTAFTLTVNGTGFASGAKIYWASTALTTTVVSGTQLTATVPASLVATAGTAGVYVVNPTMNPSNSLTFTISAAPTLTSLSPASIPAGSATFTLTVHGTGFVSGSTIMFGTASLVTTEVSSTELTAPVPAADVTATGTVVVTVVNPSVAPTNALTFTITTPIAKPTTLTPSSIQAGSSGFTLTIAGTYFVSGAVVKWNGTALTTAFFSSTSVVAQVPTSLLTTAGTASVTVTNPGVAASSALTFTITAPAPPAHLTSLSPATAVAGSATFTLTITGTGFVSGAVVDWNGTALTSAYFSSTTVVAQVPASLIASAGTASVTVVNPHVAASNALTFTITASSTPAPTVTSFSPTSGPVGTVVTVVGTNLNGVTAVRFHNANAVTFSANAAGTQMTVTVPTGAGTGTFSITTPGGTVKTTGTFTVN